MSLMIPRVHLNGTSRNELLDQLLKARRGIADAHVALQYACPNARDYYVIGPDAMKQATAEHRARVVKLTDIDKELETIMEALVE